MREYFELTFLGSLNLRIFDLGDRWSDKWQEAGDEEHQHVVFGSDHLVAFSQLKQSPVSFAQLIQIINVFISLYISLLINRKIKQPVFDCLQTLLVFLHDILTRNSSTINRVETSDLINSFRYPIDSFVKIVA